MDWDLEALGLTNASMLRRMQVAMVASCQECVLLGQLKPNENFCPPEYKRGAGCPSKKRKEQSTMRSTEVKRECKACGGLGHFAVSCQQPLTEYCFYKHREKALHWCKMMYETSADEEAD